MEQTVSGIWEPFPFSMANSHFRTPLIFLVIQLFVFQNLKSLEFKTPKTVLSIKILKDQMSKLRFHDFVYKHHLHLPITPTHYFRKVDRKRMVTILKYVNIALIPVAVSVGIYRIVIAVKTDMQYETSRNTSSVVTGVTFTWTGGLIGASIGTAIGKNIDETNGTAVGGLVGGFLGALIGFPITYLFDAVGDNLNYNIVRRNCLTCDVPFIIRVYQGWTRTDMLCKRCFYIELYKMFMFNMH